MAKATKKSESTAKTTKAAPKAAAKSKKPSAPTGTPLIDTSLVAQTAAAMIGNRAATGMPSGATSAPKSESSTFKNLKESLSKPGGSALNSILQNTTSSAAKKSSNQPFAGGKQAGHSQTFGADVNRTSVPRRTAG